jgi:hypothetical protein
MHVVIRKAWSMYLREVDTRRELLQGDSDATRHVNNGAVLRKVTGPLARRTGLRIQADAGRFEQLQVEKVKLSLCLTN